MSTEKLCDRETELAFAKSIRGAQANAAVYSITETAMLNRLKLYNYLIYVMGKMNNFSPFLEKRIHAGISLLVTQPAD